MSPPRRSVPEGSHAARAAASSGEGTGPAIVPAAVVSGQTADRDDGASRASTGRGLELLLLPLILAIAFGLRAAWPTRMAIEHFDEGVYAANLFAARLGYSYPDRHLYAPPLWPAILEWGLIAGGGAPHAPLWVNVFAGTLAVAVVWWTARSWFGPASGVLAATLITFSDFHILYSRTALTDVSLCLWLTAGVFAGWKAVLSGRPAWMATAGLLAALAWWTKYNGWLTLAVTGVGTAAWLLFVRERRVSGGQAMCRWGLTAAVSLAMWSPMLRELAPHGGYAAVARNHAQYVVGFGGWWESFMRQVAAQRYFGSWLSVCGVAAAGGVAAFVQRTRFTWNDLAVPGQESSPGGTASPAVDLRGAAAVSGARARGTQSQWFLPAAMTLASGCVYLWGNAVALGALAAWGLFRAVRPGLTRQRSRDASDPRDADRQLAVSMAAAWFVGLLVATPLYHPYPRLLLPWLSSTWFCAALLVSEPVPRVGRGRSALWLGVCGATLLVGAAIWGGTGQLRWRHMQALGVPGWEDRTALATIAGRIRQDVANRLPQWPASRARGVDCVVYVYAEPALYYHLAAHEDDAGLTYVTQPSGSLAMARPGGFDPAAPTFLVTGPHAHRHPEELAEVAAGLELVARYDYAASDLVLLDEYPAETVEVARPKAEVRLYRLVPR